MPLTDLRQYVDALRAQGDVQEIDLPVALEQELGAITRRCYETGAAAPLFNAFSDHHGGMRILGAPVGASARPREALLRVATALELPADTGGLEIVEVIAASFDLPPVAPVLVDDAPCFRNVATGYDVDLTRLPLPQLRHRDNGTDLDAWGCIVARTRDGRWTHWSMAGAARVDRRHLSGVIALAGPLGAIARTWAEAGQPMPVALALGVEPSVPFVCGLRLPIEVDQAARLGALMCRRIRTVRCVSVALEAPAGTEILIEGHLHFEDTMATSPTVAFAGYLAAEPRRCRSIVEVSAISHRDDAILPVVVAGEPVDENHTAWGIPSSAQLLHELRSAGIAVTTAWLPLQAALHWLVVTVPRDWRRRSGIDAAADLCRRIGEVVSASGADAAIAKVIVLNDDVDPTDLNELVWAFATRCHPLQGNVSFGHVATAPLPAFRRQGGGAASATGKVVYNGLPPDEWGEAMPIRASFGYGYPPHIVRRVLSRWRAYGFGACTSPRGSDGCSTPIGGIPAAALTNDPLRSN